MKSSCESFLHWTLITCCQMTCIHHVPHFLENPWMRTRPALLMRLADRPEKSCSCCLMMTMASHSTYRTFCTSWIKLTLVSPHASVHSDSEGCLTSVCWMSPVQRANFEMFGSTLFLFLDMMKRQLISVHWPYVTIVALDGEKKVACILWRGLLLSRET